MRLVLVFLFLVPTTGFADLKQIEGAFHRGDLASLTELQVEKFQLFDRAFLQYCVAVTHMSQKSAEEATAAVDLGLELLAQIENGKDDADTMALWAAFGGLKIALRPRSAMRQGPQNQRTLDHAKSLDESNATVWLVSGMALYNTPKMFGGGAKRAVEALTKSVELFESTEANSHRWGHADAYVWRARAQQKLKQVQQARSDLEQALVVSPDYAWPKQLLKGLTQD